jgi:S1-C subfamily serine protease
MFEHSDEKTAGRSDETALMLRREVVYPSGIQRRLALVAVLAALAGMTAGFAMAMIPRAAHSFQNSSVRQIHRGPIAAQSVAEPAPSITWLGVEVRTSQPAGAQVVGVFPANPADRAGLKAGDRIVALDGDPVRSSGDLVRAVRSRSPGAAIEVELERDGQRHALSAVLGERATPAAESRSQSRRGNCRR